MFVLLFIFIFLLNLVVYIYPQPLPASRDPRHLGILINRLRAVPLQSVESKFGRTAGKQRAKWPRGKLPPPPQLPLVSCFLTFRSLRSIS